MDELTFILFGALLVLGIPACAVAGFVLAFDARKRLTRLEARLAQAETRLAGLGADRAGEARAALDIAPEPEATPVSEVAPEPEATPVPAEPERPAVPTDPPARPGLEERLGTRWSVIVGGLALALGGVFLVRTAIVEGLLGPAARVALGALLAVALLTLGEVARRRTRDWRIPGLGAAHAPAASTAAGAVTGFAVVYAAHALYGFLPPAAAFLGLGAIALASMVAAALHGPMLAGIGLLGALWVPLLVATEAPSAWALPPYLAAVVAAAYGVARLRLWRALAIAAAIGAGLWTLVLIAMAGDPLPALVHIVLQSLLAAAAFVVVPARAAPRAALDATATAVLAGCAALAALALTELALAPSAIVAFAFVVSTLLVVLAWLFAPAAASRRSPSPSPRASWTACGATASRASARASPSPSAPSSSSSRSAMRSRAAIRSRRRPITWRPASSSPRRSSSPFSRGASRRCGPIR